MLVSVIIPHFNDLDGLDRALKSVLEQTYTEIEILVVNDAGPISLHIPYYAELCDKKINIINLPKNVGPAAARNKAIELSKGEFIAFLDSDDSWHPFKVSTQVTAMLQQNAAFSAHDYKENSDVRYLPCDPIKFKFRSANELLYFSFIHTPTVMVKRKNFVNFPSDFRRAEDFVCWIVNLQNQDCLFLNQSLARGYKSAVGESGLTQCMRKLHIAQLAALRLLHNNKIITASQYTCAMIWERIKYPIRRYIK